MMKIRFWPRVLLWGLVAAAGCSSSTSATDGGAGDSGSGTSDGGASSDTPLPTGFPELPLPPTPTGKIVSVGPGQTYLTPCAALTKAQDGDTIQIAAGSYPGDTCTITANNLTIQAVGGPAVIDITGVKPSGCKALWVVAGHDTLIDGVEFAGAHLRDTDTFVKAGQCPADHNGAGIRLEGVNLTLRHCNFHDNDDGILAGDNPTSAVLIETSQFRNNSLDGYSHNLYINHVAQLTFRYNYSGRTSGPGHLLKSRAKLSVVVYNRLTGEDGASSYELSFPNGGQVYAIGNSVQQGDTTQNPALLDYASEGLTAGYDSHIYIASNTFVNRRTAGGTFVQLFAPATAQSFNNLYLGTGSTTNLAGSLTQQADQGNGAGNPLLLSEATFDFHIQAGSSASGAGQSPGSGGGYALTPVNEYVHPASARARHNGPALDVGAFATAKP